MGKYFEFNDMAHAGFELVDLSFYLHANGGRSPQKAQHFILWLIILI